MHIARKHHMISAQASAGRADALAHAGRVDRHRGRAFENACAGRFRRSRKTERVIERMNVEGARKMHGAEIARIGQRLAHAGYRPAFDIDADPAQPLDVGIDGALIVGL